MKRTVNITRFNKVYPVNIVAVYIKGKQHKPRVDNIRFVVDQPSFWYDGYVQSESGLELVMPEPPKSDPAYHAFFRCPITGILYNDRPESIGNLAIIETNFKTNDDGTFPSHVKVRVRNYYLVDDEELANRYIDLVVNELECLTK